MVPNCGARGIRQGVRRSPALTIRWSTTMVLKLTFFGISLTQYVVIMASVFMVFLV